MWASIVRTGVAKVVGWLAGLALAACSADPETEPAPPPATQTTTSSSSTPEPEPADPGTMAPASVPTSTAPPSLAPPPAVRLPANVIATGGPCQTLGEVAQAEDGSPLFCIEDPGGAGPLWLPPSADTDPDATVGAALPGRPCTQEGVAVPGPDGTVLTCSLTGGGDTPGGLYWQ